MGVGEPVSAPTAEPFRDTKAPRNLAPAAWAAKLIDGDVTLSPLQENVLTALVQHRLLTTRQLQDLLNPARRPEFLGRQLLRLQAAELVECTPVQSKRNDKAWWATTGGRGRVASSLRPRQYLMNADRARSGLQRHTLLTNQIGLEFVRWSRDAGHECGPLDWDNEIGHRARDGEIEAGAMVVSDLRVRFILHDEEHGDAAVVRLIEADRGTETIHALTEKVRNYCRMVTYVHAEARRNGDTMPLWRRNYSAFPKVAIVFADRDPEWMRRRARQLIDLCHADALINRHLGEVGLLCTTMDQLSSRGPFQPIFWNADQATVDILDNTQAPPTPRGRSA